MRLELPRTGQRWVHDDYGRQGFLALLLEAEIGDRITGLTLMTEGEVGEIDMGVLIKAGGCEYRIYNEGRVYTFREYMTDYLEEISSEYGAAMIAVPPWRTFVHRYRLPNGKTFKDSTYTDLPDWYAWSGTMNSQYQGVSVGAAFLSDRYGNDYVSIQVNLGVGGGLPAAGEYSEGYTFDLTREWGTNIPYTLDEEHLKDAMTGIDVGAGFTIMGLDVSGSVGLDLPIYQTVAFGYVVGDLIGAGVSGSFTFLIPDIPSTDGWDELDRFPTYPSIWYRLP